MAHSNAPLVGNKHLSTRQPSPGIDERLPQDGTIIEYNEEYEKLNSSYQLSWNKLMEEGPYEVSSAYQKVAVLLISWAKEFDDLGVENEVHELGAVFKDIYNFKVRPVQLRCESGKNPQTRVTRHVAEFVDDEGGPRTLLIVYYAGHGTPGRIDGFLELAGKSTPNQIREKLDKVVWNWTEYALRGTNADVLEIFDCCYAGGIGGLNRDIGKKAFEFLAATSSNSLTRLPGEQSFTTALIWALKEFANKGRRFTTSELLNKIREDAPNFPKKQVPVLSERGGASSSERIMLEPIPRPGDPASSKTRRTTESTTQELLTLQFMFKARPSPEEVERLGLELNGIMAKHPFGVNRIMWGGLKSWPNSVIVEAASKFKALGSKRQLRNAFSSNGPEVEDFRDDLTPSLNPVFVSKQDVRDAFRSELSHELMHKTVSYHSRMLVFALWASVLSLSRLFPDKSLSFRVTQGLIMVLTLCTAIWIGLGPLWISNGAM